LKSANCVPAEVELLNTIAAVEQQLSAASEEDQPALRRVLAGRRAELAVLLERNRRV
jgi:hypothetical protein